MRTICLKGKFIYAIPYLDFFIRKARRFSLDDASLQRTIRLLYGAKPRAENYNTGSGVIRAYETKKN